VLVLLPAFALALASCGDDDEPLTKAQFTREMNALCKERDKKANALLDSGEFFAMEEGAKTWPKVKPIVADFIDRVSELEAPDDAEEVYDRYLEGGDQISTLIDDASDAAADRDQRAYSKALARIFADIDSTDQTMADYGAEQCWDEDEALPQSERPAADATVVEVDATEYAFEFPDGIKSGKTAFRMVNRGDEIHILGFGRLKDGATFEQVKASLERGEDDPGLLEDESITGIAGPDDSATTNAELTAGTYVAYCFLPAPDGESHYLKGMLVPFTVT
jgi:hypothetical protein